MRKSNKMLAIKNKLICTFIALILSLISLGYPITSSRLPQNVVSTRELFEKWIIDYGRTYESNDEKERRFLIFQDNVKYMETFNNAPNNTYTLGINQFTDLTNDEFQATYTGSTAPELSSKSDDSFQYENVTQLPPSIDWRHEGAVTEVKNQRQRGSCWAFAVVGAVEGINKIVKGNLISLSEQELIDCDNSPRDHGCKSGVVPSAYDFIAQNGGLVAEDTYPYKAVTRSCNKAVTTPSVARITGHQRVPYNDENALQKAVANQPVTVSVEPSPDWMHYKSGVFTGQCGTNTHHAVVVVGYGATQDGTKFWIAKNSWGTGWGESGYIRLLRDVQQKSGLCGIAMFGFYPTLK